MGWASTRSSDRRNGEQSDSVAHRVVARRTVLVPADPPEPLVLLGALLVALVMFLVGTWLGH